MLRMIEKRKFVYLVTGLMCMITLACQKEEIISERDYPRIDIIEIILQEESGVTFKGVFLTEAGEILDKGFLWSRYGDPYLGSASKVSAGAGYGTGSFQATACSDLIAGEEYMLRAYNQTNDLVVYSRTITFTCKYSFPNQ